MTTDFEWRLDCGTVVTVHAEGRVESDIYGFGVEDLKISYDFEVQLTPLAIRELREAESSIEDHAVQRLCDERGAA